MRRIILTLAIILFASIVQADAEPPVILGAGPAKLFQFNDVFFTGENFYINNQNKVEEGFVKKKGSTEWVEPMCFDINGGEEGSFYVANMSVGVYDLKIVRSDNQESPIYETAFEILPNQCIVPSVAGVELKGFGYGGGKVTILGNNFMPGLVASILKEDGDVIVTHETYHSITKNTEIPMIVPLSEMEGSSSGLAGLDGKKIVVTNPECDTPTEYSIDVGPAIVSVKHGVVYMNSEATAMIYLSDLASSSYGEIDVSSIDFGCITVLEVEANIQMEELKIKLKTDKCYGSQDLHINTGNIDMKFDNAIFVAVDPKILKPTPPKISKKILDFFKDKKESEGEGNGRDSGRK